MLAVSTPAFMYNMYPESLDYASRDEPASRYYLTTDCVYHVDFCPFLYQERLGTAADRVMYVHSAVTLVTALVFWENPNLAVLDEV